MSVYLCDSAVALPNAPVTNEQIEAVLGQVGGKPSMARARVLRANGIKSRHYAIDPATGRPTHNNAQLTAEAVRQLLAASGLTLSDIDLLACGTASPDVMMPAHGPMVHGALGGGPLAVHTTAGACCASMAALNHAVLSVAAGVSRRAIVTGSELLSSLMHARHFEPEVEERVRALEENPHLAFEHDFLRWMLSDGAGAVLVQSEPRAGAQRPPLRVEWMESLSFAGEMDVCMYHGGRKGASGFTAWREVEDPRDVIRGGFLNFAQDARMLGANIGRLMGEGLRRTLERHPLSTQDVDWFLPHLSSNFFRGEMERQLAQSGLALPPERIFTNLATRGNTGNASLFIMLDELWRSGRLEAGQRLLCFVPESARFMVSFLSLRVGEG